MGKVEQIEEQIISLSEAEFARLRDWILERDAESWDAEFEEDVRSGKLDALAEAAKRSQASGATTEL